MLTFENLEDKNPEEILDLIEKIDFGNLVIYQIQDAFMVALKKYEELGEIEKINELRKEVKIFGMDYSITRKRFIPIVGECIEFNEEEIKYYKKRAKESQNDVLKARYCDIIWNNDKDVEFVKLGIRSYIESSKKFFKAKNYYKMAGSLERAFILAKSIKNEELQLTCLNLHFQCLDCLHNIGERRFMYNLLDNILDHGYYIKEKIDLNKVHSYINDNFETHKQVIIPFR